MKDLKMGPSVKAIEAQESGDSILSSDAVDPMDRNRHVWTKGRMEFSPYKRVCFTQGHGVPGYENQKRVPGAGYWGRDRYAIDDLGVDVEEY